MVLAMLDLIKTKPKNYKILKPVPRDLAKEKLGCNNPDAWKNRVELVLWFAGVLLITQAKPNHPDKREH